MASKSIKKCPVMEGNTTCGETETLAIINEFKTLYERKMHKIDSEAGGDNLPVLQAKIHLQKQWIRDLTAQNELLVRAVEELEKEATEKVIMLEGKLRGQGMEGTDAALDSRGYPLDAQAAELLREKEDELGNMSRQLQDKTDEVQAVRRSLLDMRSALTIEVAEKHDVILSLRRDVQEYEEKCRQSNKQTQFRDDIIKELRKEIKSLKEEKSMEVEEDCNYIKKNIQKLDEENNACKEEVARLKQEIARLQGDAQGLSDERDNFRRQSEDASKQISSMNEQMAKERANLQQENADKSEELENTRRASTIMASDLNSDLDNERVERKKQSDQVSSLSEENQRQYDKMQELYAQIKQLEQSAGIVYCHCDESDSGPTETKHISVNTDEFVSKPPTAQSDTSRAAQSDTSGAAQSDTSRAAPSDTSTAAPSDVSTVADTWLTTDSDAKDEEEEEEEEVEEIRILTVIEMTEHTITTDNGSGRIAELEEQLEKRSINADNGNERIAELEEQLERRTITSDNASDRIAELKEQLERHTITSINANDRIAELEEQLARAMKESEIERAKHNQEMNNLKQTIMQLEKSGQSHGAIETNAVELYKTSVTLLEVSEEQANVEVLQQRQTILNLQEALVSSKHQIEELQQKLSNEVSFGWPIRWFGSSSTDSKLSSDDKNYVHDI